MAVCRRERMELAIRSTDEDRPWNRAARRYVRLTASWLCQALGPKLLARCELNRGDRAAR